MATCVIFDDFREQLLLAKHNFAAAGHIIKCYLSNNAATPNANTATNMADVAEISAGNNYLAGGIDITNDVTQSSNIARVTGNDVVWTASGGNFGPFRYAVLYNANSTTPSNALICYWDYGSSISCNNGESFTVDFNATAILELTNT
jgi:hypothetical protein